MSKTISVNEQNYKWLVCESGRQTTMQKNKVSIDKIIELLIKKWNI